MAVDGILMMTSLGKAFSKQKQNVMNWFEACLLISLLILRLHFELVGEDSDINSSFALFALITVKVFY